MGQSDDQKLHLTLLHSGLGTAWARIALPSLVAVVLDLCLPFIQWWFLIWLLSLPTVALGLKETAVTGTNWSKPMGRAVSWLRAGQQIERKLPALLRVESEGSGPKVLQEDREGTAELLLMAARPGRKEESLQPACPLDES